MAQNLDLRLAGYFEKDIKILWNRQTKQGDHWSLYFYWTVAIKNVLADLQTVSESFCGWAFSFRETINHRWRSFAPHTNMHNHPSTAGIINVGKNSSQFLSCPLLYYYFFMNCELLFVFNIFFCFLYFWYCVYETYHFLWTMCMTFLFFNFRYILFWYFPTHHGISIRWVGTTKNSLRCFIL